MSMNGIADQLLGVVSRRDAAEDDLDVRSDFVDPLGHGQASLHVDHPVQVDADERRIQGARATASTSSSGSAAARVLRLMSLHVVPGRPGTAAAS